MTMHVLIRIHCYNRVGSGCLVRSYMYIAYLHVFAAIYSCSTYSCSTCSANFAVTQIMMGHWEQKLHIFVEHCVHVQDMMKP